VAVAAALITGSKFGLCLAAWAKGPAAATMNGVYRPLAGEGVGGKPVYMKDGADTWIEYWARNNGT
jgi:hypothetical protein